MQRNNNTEPLCSAGVVSPINMTPVPLLSTRWRHMLIEKITIMARLQSTDFIVIQGRRHGGHYVGTLKLFATRKQSFL